MRLPQNGTGGVIEMTNRLPIQRCQYCGCEDIGLGWQHGEALVRWSHSRNTECWATDCGI